MTNIWSQAMGHYTVFCDLSQWCTILYLLLNRVLYCILGPVSMGHYTVFAFKMASVAL